LTAVGVPVQPAELLAHPTVAQLVAHLQQPERDQRRRGRGPSAAVREPIAIVGLAIETAGAADAAAFWQLLAEGRCAVGELSAERSRDVAAWHRSAGRELPHVPRAGWLRRIDTFDANAFGWTPAAAALVDPAHRKVLEAASVALHDAGWAHGAHAARTGVFVGHVGDHEGTRYRQLLQELVPDRLPRAVLGNLSSFVAGQLADRFDLSGPAMVVDTACSASLVAVHLACRALQAGDCDVAVVAAARVDPLPGAPTVRVGFESQSGRSRPFDAGADGAVMGEGAAALVLKPLSAAQRDGDAVHAVLLGSAVNHDGRGAGPTVPNPTAQAEVIETAWAEAGLPPERAAFLEAHGTGTRLGDPAEIHAVNHAFGGAERPIPVGSVKANVGHLQQAAGLVGLVKAVLALQHRVWPGTPGFRQPNPDVPFDSGPARPSARSVPLADDAELVGGVTSLGLSGTNAHVVVQAPPSVRSVPRRDGTRVASRVRCWPAAPGAAAEGEAFDGLRALREALRRVAGLELADRELHMGFFALGLDSVELMQVHQALSTELSISLDVARLHGELSTPRALADWLDARSGASRVSSPQPSRSTGAGEWEPSEALIEAVAERTRASQSHTDDARSALANNRAAAGFRPPLKRMVHPIVAAEAKGARLVDIDGNEYVDIAMGFGVHLLGHAPHQVRTAVAEAMARGMPLGPMDPLAARVAGRIARATGHDRVAFYNSGTEAVMVALRLARAVTGRRGVALFGGSYHGTADAVLAAAGEEGRGVPLAPGVPRGAVADTWVLDYGDEAALQRIRSAAGSLAAVLVEPVQSRRPEHQPVRFLRRLRQLCSELDIALVFDEVITGFRLGLGGAAERFGVQPDLATYGKVVGGGLPIGVVAGSARFMAPVDGGAWRSDAPGGPQGVRTFVAGTFCHHPLAMAAADAVLERLESEGPALFEGLQRRTEGLCERLDAVLAAHHVDIRTARCGSLFRFRHRGTADAFYARLLLEGVYLWEGRTCFLSTAHTDADLDHIVAAVARACQERAVLARGGVQGVTLCWEGAVDLQRLESGARALAARRGLSVTVGPYDPEATWPRSVRRLWITVEPEVQQLTVRAHRSQLDGWSLGVALQELASLYRGAALPAVPAHELPEQPATEATRQAARIRVDVPASSLRARARQADLSLFAWLLEAFRAWLAESSLADRALVHPVALQATQGPALVMGPHTSLHGATDSARAVVLNLDRVPDLSFGPAVSWTYGGAVGSHTAHDLVVNVVEAGDDLVFEWKVALDVADASTARRWAETFSKHLSSESSS
nr:aminotransferase class III-fold pyridoxal phosphate-dependent enzyme [Myxococcales bacterium]